MDYELSLFNVNPIRFITETSRETYRVAYTYIFNGKGYSVHISEHSNFIDALNARDSLVVDWYGNSFSDKLNNLRDGILDTDDKYIMIGGYFFNRKGKILNSVLKEYSPEHIKNGVEVFRIKARHELKARSLYLSAEDLFNIFNGYGLITLINKKEFYINATANYIDISDKKKDSILYKNRKRSRLPSGAIFSDKKIAGVKNCFPNSYQARIVIDKKEYYIGKSSNQETAQMLFFDAYYLFRGYLHTGDKREI